jgi:hypothetical protein
MKKLLLILLCLPLLFSTCKKEDESTNAGDNNTGNNNSIEGSWYLAEVEELNYDSLDNLYSQSTSLITMPSYLLWNLNVDGSLTGSQADLGNNDNDFNSWLDENIADYGVSNGTSYAYQYVEFPPSLTINTMIPDTSEYYPWPDKIFSIVELTETKLSIRGEFDGKNGGYSLDTFRFQR